MSVSSGAGQSGKIGSGLARCCASLGLLVLLAFSHGPASACETGCSGTCTISLSASGTYLDPTYIASAPVVSTPTLVSLLTAGAPVALIDCRAADALAEPRIPGSMVFVAGWNEDGIAGRFPSKDILMVLYDGGAISVRGEVRRLFSEAGFTNILQYPDGIQGWIAAGQPTVPTASDSFLGTPEIQDQAQAPAAEKSASESVHSR